MADYSDAAWFSLIGFEEQQSKRLIMTGTRGFCDLGLKLRRRKKKLLTVSLIDEQ